MAVTLTPSFSPRVAVCFSLAFSVTLFCCEAVMAIGLMLLRRHPKVGGELGGPRGTKIVSSLFLFSLWVFYIAMSALEAYEVLPKMGQSPNPAQQGSQ